MELFESKIFLLLIFFIIFLIYLPINRKVPKKYFFKLFVDNLIPFYPIFIIPYVSFYFLGALSIFFAFDRSILEFQQFMLALSLASIISYFIFILLPGYIVRPTIQNNNFLHFLIKLIYQYDWPVNVFPSGHTFYTTIVSLFFINWYPGNQNLILLLAFLNIISVVFVKQHYIVDIMGGLALGYISYLVSLALIY